jgi:NAD(P)-dependent dehydrogenase (short-subunit alcohol dehydrogenase family)
MKFVTGDSQMDSLTELLAKDSNNLDPARVINISSTSSVDPYAESALSNQGEGTWSCQLFFFCWELPLMLTNSSDQPSKAAVNHLTSSLAVSLSPRHITYVDRVQFILLL